MNKYIFNLTKNGILRLNYILTKPFKEPKIKNFQNEILFENYDKKTCKLIIFLTSGYDMVNGGILSISSIYDETRKLNELHDTCVILCTVPGEPLLLKYSKFENQNWIFNLSDVLSYFENLESLMIHVPEYACGLFLDNISKSDYSILDHINNLHINILIQNIEVATKNLNDIKRIKRRFNKVTATTAHERYSNHHSRQLFSIPLHKLSVYVSPEQYVFKSYNKKRDLMIVSHDKHPQKSKILHLIQDYFPNLKIQVIEDMPYMSFKKLISDAKWALTFGEGLDGYFVEPIFSGAISFSVYNHKFFTKDFESLKTVYHDYDELMQKLPDDLKKLDNENNYTLYQQKQYNLCSKYYDYEEYLNNLKLFYQGDYTFK